MTSTGRKLKSSYAGALVLFVACAMTEGGLAQRTCTPLEIVLKALGGVGLMPRTQSSCDRGLAKQPDVRS